MLSRETAENGPFVSRGSCKKHLIKRTYLSSSSQHGPKPTRGRSECCRAQREACRRDRDSMLCSARHGRLVRAALKDNVSVHCAVKKLVRQREAPCFAVQNAGIVEVL